MATLRSTTSLTPVETTIRPSMLERWLQAHFAIHIGIREALVDNRLLFGDGVGRPLGILQ